MACIQGFSVFSCNYNVCRSINSLSCLYCCAVESPSKSNSSLMQMASDDSFFTDLLTFFQIWNTQTSTSYNTFYPYKVCNSSLIIKIIVELHTITHCILRQVKKVIIKYEIQWISLRTDWQQESLSSSPYRICIAPITDYIEKTAYSVSKVI